MWKLNDKNGVKFYTISSFEDTGLVRHGFSTREGGVSKGCYASMNLRFHCDDDRANVLKNYEIISNALGIDHTRLVLSHQTHGDIIHTASENDLGNGVVRENAFESVDALITDKANIPLVTLYADCTPVFFLDPVRRVIALAHSGWRGTVQRISAKVVRKMAAEYGSNPSDILTAIGPSIQCESFEVGDEVAEIFIREFGADTAVKYGDKYHVDMQKAIRIQLENEGVKSVNDCGIDTYENSGFLFSHRKTNGKRGNMGAFLELI